MPGPHLKPISTISLIQTSRQPHVVYILLKVTKVLARPEPEFESSAFRSSGSKAESYTCIQHTRRCSESLCICVQTLHQVLLTISKDPTVAILNIFSAWEVAQRESACLAYIRSWVPSLALQKKKKVTIFYYFFFF
jgi:hypothetical protein